LGNLGNSGTSRKKARQAAASTPVGLPGPLSSDSFDVLLAQHRPFGDSVYLHEQVQARYHQRLLKIAADLPVAGALSGALEGATPYRQYRTLGDPVVRNAIHQVLRHLWHGSDGGRLATEGPSHIDGLSLAGCEEIFRETIGHLDGGGGRGGPLESGGAGLRRLGAEVCHGSLWSEEHRDDVFGRSFRRMVHDNFRGDPLCVPTAADAARIAVGAELLGVLMPHCARSVLSHAHLTVIVPHVGSWKRKGSCSEFRLPGIIFLNREMLANPWWVAEHLLHESLHQKLYDFRHTHSLLAEDLSADWQPGAGAAAVRAIWNVGGASAANAWDTFRAIAAFHVYVHLAAFSVQVERRCAELARRFGPPPEGKGPAMTHRREAFERAQFLGRRIKDGCWQEMGPAGRLLVAWLGSVLGGIDPAPPPRDSLYLHLLLDRYLLEANLVAEKEGLSAQLEARLGEVVGAEVEIVRSVLVTVQADRDELDRLDDAVSKRSGELAGAAFRRFRSAAAGILRGHSPGGYGLRITSSIGAPGPSTAALDQRIEAMVNRSTDDLLPVLELAPRATR
jgi:hypothetical protein